jgi:CRP-like cAMP-binding protein
MAGYQFPPAEVIRILAKAVSHIAHVATDTPPIARVGGFGESGIIYEVKYWTREYHLRDSIDAEIRRAIWYAFRRNGIVIPFPIRTLQRYSASSGESEVPSSDVADRLAEVDILAPLSEEERRSLAAGARLLNYSRGETIISYGQEGDSMFVIHAGSVSVQMPSPEGPVEVAQLGPGSIFGEVALLTGESRTADVVALSDVAAVKIGKQLMEPLMHENPGLASALSLKIAERQTNLASATPTAREEESRSVLDRIRLYFGLTR